MIDLSTTREVLAEAQRLLSNLDGRDLDETNAVQASSKTNIRTQRAKMSQDLQLLASRLELAAQLVRIEYWYARGERDPLDHGRDD